ncbi:RNA polymerase ECF-subfamily sigma factor [[Actinomadura] parvosata subsp. kistnae]|uniref:RNA polymerase subunit sigma-24 n=1 Tax=[Actinomadura] parvosata subsp. kistnae TaxID=1909395 RepID=A0A1V0AE28_9ACTN|nr:RNA polymerase sigma factor [Nonomuraea sp. ATCC 55076]AQZ68468.1 RNA polymerase subunit sigma-24 [Nonomuraea sp. ATCC 55076]SPL93081.1 RNA polymerase ECF-subfamily sigma factor [Actinomadura parvosata subsp. kistnae]
MRPSDLWRRRAADPPAVDPDSTDAELLAAVAARSTAALRLLHQRHAPWLRARLSRRCADPDVVDDALQETFLAVWRSAGRFDGGNPAGWLWTIAVRRLISALRGGGARWIGTGADPDGHAGQVTGSAEEAVLLGVEHGDLGTALNRLSPELRAVIEATVLDGLTTKEAAHLLGIPEGTVKSRAARARARLREELS